MLHTICGLKAAGKSLFLPVLQAGLYLCLLMTNYWMDWHKIWYRRSWFPVEEFGVQNFCIPALSVGVIRLHKHCWNMLMTDACGWASSISPAPRGALFKCFCADILSLILPQNIKFCFIQRYFSGLFLALFSGQKVGMAYSGGHELRSSPRPLPFVWVWSMHSKNISWTWKIFWHSFLHTPPYMLPHCFCLISTFLSNLKI